MGGEHRSDNQRLKEVAISATENFAYHMTDRCVTHAVKNGMDKEFWVMYDSVYIDRTLIWEHAVAIAGATGRNISIPAEVAMSSMDRLKRDMGLGPTESACGEPASPSDTGRADSPNAKVHDPKREPEGSTLPSAIIGKHMPI